MKATHATMETLQQQWMAAAGSRDKDRMVAKVLGVTVTEDALPHYSSNILDAQRAMDLAWEQMEESAPVRISCHISSHGKDANRECYVEWWPADGDHLMTPRFLSEAESRAFAAFVFASLLGRV